MKLRLLNETLERQWAHYSSLTFDNYVSRNLPDCDLFCGYASFSTKSGVAAQKRGIRYVCDRGCSHIRFQDEILREEFDLQDIPFPGIDQRVVEREESEYERADAILVPSTFSLNTFLQKGVEPKKLKLAPYGVNISAFHPSEQAPENAFHVLFVGTLSVRKGFKYLVEAFDKLDTPNKRLRFAGMVDLSAKPLLDQMKDRADISFLGHVKRPNLSGLMSRSHVLVLPSVEDGFGLVLAQAMACRCPVIATNHTGAADLITDGKEGFITPLRNVDAMANRLQQLADDPGLRDRMAQAGLERTQSIGGWDDYGEIVYSAFSEVVNS